MREGSRLFSSFSFWLDKGTLRCGNNFWSNFLRSIVLVVKAFQLQEMQFSPNRTMQQEQRSLTICWTPWIVLPWVLYYPWSCSLFPASHSMAYTLPPPRWAHVDSHDYTFLSGLQAQEIQLGSPDCFLCERCGLGTRLQSPEVAGFPWNKLVVCFNWSTCASA